MSGCGGSLRYDEVVAWARSRGAGLGALEESVRWHTAAAPRETTAAYEVLHAKPSCRQLLGERQELRIPSVRLPAEGLCPECGFAPVRAEAYALSARALMAFEEICMTSRVSSWSALADLAQALRSRTWENAAGVPAALEEVNARLVEEGWRCYERSLTRLRAEDRGVVARRCALELALGRLTEPEDSPRGEEPRAAAVLERAQRAWRAARERGARTPERAAWHSLRASALRPGMRAQLRRALLRWEGHLTEVVAPFEHAPDRILVLPRGYLGGAELLEAVGLRYGAVEAANAPAPRAPAALVVPAVVAAWTCSRAGSTGAVVDLGEAAPGERGELLSTLMQVADAEQIGAPPTTHAEARAIEAELHAALACARAVLTP